MYGGYGRYAMCHQFTLNAEKMVVIIRR